MTAPSNRTASPLWHAQADMGKVSGHRKVIVGGEGAHVWGADKRRLLDLPAGLWSCAVGHGRIEIAAAAEAQMRILASYSNFQRYATGPALALAERLRDLSPIGDVKVILMSNGSDAVDAAAKLVRRYWAAVGRPEKQVLVARSWGYHGMHGFGTALGGMEKNREGLGEPVGRVRHIPHDDISALKALLSDCGESIAAVFCEPIIGTGGVLTPVPGYLAAMQELCREHDVLLVADEVITGFGRTGSLFACETYDFKPDILLFAKAVTSGYLPLGGMLVGESVAEPFWRSDGSIVFRHGLTNQGHATACAAALANLDLLEEERLVARSEQMGAALGSALRAMKAAPGVVEVRQGPGLIAGIQLRTQELADRVVGLCWEDGIITRTIAGGDVVQVSPPLVIEEQDLRLGCTRIAEAIALTAPLLDATSPEGDPFGKSLPDERFAT